MYHDRATRDQKNATRGDLNATRGDLRFSSGLSDRLDRRKDRLDRRNDRLDRRKSESEIYALSILINFRDHWRSRPLRKLNPFVEEGL